MPTQTEYTDKANDFNAAHESAIAALYQELATLEATETQNRADLAEELRFQLAGDSLAAKELLAKADTDRLAMLSDMQFTQNEQMVAAANARAVADILRREQDATAIDAIFARGANRGRMIWPMFRYQVDTPSNIEETRMIMFGVYSGVYVHGIKYLTDVTNESLEQIVNNYDQAMAELSADEQNAINDLMARRYLEELSLAAKDAAMINKHRKLALAVSETDAKIAALEADRKALETKRLQLLLAQEKSAITIAELEAQLRSRYYADKQVEFDLIKAELEQDKAAYQTALMSLRVIDAQREVLESAYKLEAAKIELQELNTANTRLGLDIEEVDLKVSQTEAETAHLTVQISKEALVEQELEVAKAETTTYIAGTELVKSKGALTDARIMAADDQLTDVLPKLVDAIEKDKIADLAIQEANSDHKIRNYGTQTEAHNQKAAISTTISGMEIENYKEEGQLIQDNYESRVRYDEARVFANKKKNDAAADAAEIMREANITNVLTHSIGKAL